MYYFSEESKILTLRARIIVLGILNASIIGLSFWGIDDNYHREFLQAWLPVEQPIPQLLYYMAAGLLGVLAASVYLRNSSWSSQVVVLSLALVFARFIHYYLPGYAIAAALYVAGAFYLFALVSNIFQTALVRIAAILSSAFILLILVMIADGLRYHHYWATFGTILFTFGVWTRYFWLLEYKRRQKCPECSGWGKKTAKFNDIFWWALGYKERTQSGDYELETKQTMMRTLGYKDYQALPSTCPTCQGKGWHYRDSYADDILYTPDLPAPTQTQPQAQPQTVVK